MKKLSRIKLWLSSLLLGSVVPLAQADHSSLPAFSRQESVQIAEFLSQMNTRVLRNGENVWLRAKDGFHMPEVHPDLIAAHEARYSRNLASFQRLLERSQPYLFHIVNEVEQRGMPAEIAFLPLVESAFNAQATSHVGAAGLWQFMPATGRQYGLEQTWWYDGRRDVVAATRAALDYLEVLHRQFNDWHLALAAYNWGEGNLSRAIARNRAAGLGEDFASLKLPKETRNYVPKLLAVRNILSNPQRYPLALKKLPNQPYFASLSTGKHMDLAVVAKLAETSEQELLRLNPAYQLPVFAYKAGREILLPIDKIERFHANLAKHKAPLMSMQAYLVQDEERLEDVAARFNMDETHLRKINRLAKHDDIKAGQALLVALNADAPNAPKADQDEAVLTADLAENLPAPKSSTSDLNTVNTVFATAAKLPKAKTVAKNIEDQTLEQLIATIK